MDNRIQQELQNCRNLFDDQLQIKTLNDNMWQIIIKGPKLGPYENGQFFLNLEFSKDYPKVPPKIRMLNKIYHMNINQQGQIALNTLKKEWSQSMNVSKILQEILELFDKPNKTNPLNVKVAEQYQTNYQLYFEKAQQWTQKYATFIDIKID